jgi:hypothetical protein
MKQLAFTLMLFVVVLSPLAAFCQLLPDGPAAQAPPPQVAAADDAAWARIERLARGEPIVVTSTYGPVVHCLFAGATDRFLFCDPVDNPAGTGYRFDRDKVEQVDEDRWQPPATATQEHDSHRGLLLASGLTGIVMGALGAQGSDARTGVTVGVISAGFVGCVGMLHSVATGAFSYASHGRRAHRVRVYRRAPVRR